VGSKIVLQQNPHFLTGVLAFLYNGLKTFIAVVLYFGRYLRALFTQPNSTELVVNVQNRELAAAMNHA